MRFLILFLLCVPFADAQNMDSLGGSTLKGSVPKELSSLLKQDTTDELTYINGKFVCHNFATTLYLQRSSLVTTLEEFDLDSIAVDWGVVVKRLGDSCKLPIYYVSLSQEETGFYHAINALLVNPEKPEDLSSYIFIEPQSDDVMLTGDQVFKKYSRYYQNKVEKPVVKLKISTLESVKRYNGPGTILQSSTKNLYEFKLSGD
jgi:hypothetical protein